VASGEWKGERKSCTKEWKVASGEWKGERELCAKEWKVASGEWKVESAKPAKRFEDLIAWQKARELVRDIYRLTRGATFRQDPSLVDQLRRAAVSSMTNIAEGFERHSRTDFAHFLNIAGASAGEVRSQLYVVEDCELASASVAGELRNRTEEVGRVIGGLRAAVLRRRDETGK